MSDENTAAAPREETSAGDRPSGWFAFAEQTVLLQLKEAYIAVTYAYQPVMKDGGVVASPILTGVLHVEPSGNGGVMLALQMPMEGNDYSLVAINIDMIAYCTLIHQSRVVLP